MPATAKVWQISRLLKIFVSTKCYASLSGPSETRMAGRVEAGGSRARLAKIEPIPGPTEIALPIAAGARVEERSEPVFADGFGCDRETRLLLPEFVIIQQEPQPSNSVIKSVCYAGRRSMVKTDDPAECLARASQERALAAAATLDRVRDRHLRSAETWEDLAVRVTTMTETKERVRTNPQVPNSVAAERGSKGGTRRAGNYTPEQRSEMARYAAKKRWAKD